MNPRKIVAAAGIAGALIFTSACSAPQPAAAGGTPTSSASATQAASAAATPSASPSFTATQTGESFVSDPKAKLPEDMNAGDVMIAPNFTLGKEQSDSAIALSTKMLSLYTSAFPQYQRGDFPTAPVEDLLANEVAPKMRPLVTDNYWNDESNRFLAKDGTGMIITSMLSGDATNRKKVELTEGNTCTAADEPFDVRYVNNTLSLAKDPGTNNDVAMLHTTGNYMISCKEGRPLFAQMETDIWMDRTADGGWITSKAVRSAAHGLKLITVLNK